MRQLTLPVAEARVEDLAWMRSRLDEQKARNVTAEHIEHFYDLTVGDRELALEAIQSILEGKAHRGLAGPASRGAPGVRPFASGDNLRPLLDGVFRRSAPV